MVDLSSGLTGGQFHYAFWEISSETKKVPDVAPLTSNIRPRILAKVGCTTFRIVLIDSSLLEIVRNHFKQLLGL